MHWLFIAVLHESTESYFNTTTTVRTTRVILLLKLTSSRNSSSNKTISSNRSMFNISLISICAKLHESNSCRFIKRANSTVIARAQQLALRSRISHSSVTSRALHSDARLVTCAVQRAERRGSSARAFLDDVWTKVVHSFDVRSERLGARDTYRSESPEEDVVEDVACNAESPRSTVRESEFARSPSRTATTRGLRAIGLTRTWRVAILVHTRSQRRQSVLRTGLLYRLFTFAAYNRTTRCSIVNSWSFQNSTADSTCNWWATRGDWQQRWSWLSGPLPRGKEI